MATLGVLFGGLSPEHDVGIITGLQAAHLLGQRGHDVAPLYWTRSGAWERVPPGLEAPDFAEGRVAGATPLTLVVPEGFVERRRLGREAPLALEAVVNCCHGGPGEDGTITALLLLCGIPVSGPQPEGAAWAMDKLATAGMVAAAGLERFGIESIPTAVLAADTTAIDLPTPWVVKPRFGGSSLGVHTDVADLETAKALAGRGPASAGAVVQPQAHGLGRPQHRRAHPPGAAGLGDRAPQHRRRRLQLPAEVPARRRRHGVGAKEGAGGHPAGRAAAHRGRRPRAGARRRPARRPARRLPLRRRRAPRALRDQHHPGLAGPVPVERHRRRPRDGGRRPGRRGAPARHQPPPLVGHDRRCRTSRLQLRGGQAVLEKPARGPTRACGRMARSRGSAPRREQG